MTTIATEVMRSALENLIDRQQSIENMIMQPNHGTKADELIHEQTDMLKRTSDLFNQMF